METPVSEKFAIFILQRLFGKNTEITWISEIGWKEHGYKWYYFFYISYLSHYSSFIITIDS